MDLLERYRRSCRESERKIPPSCANGTNFYKQDVVSFFRSTRPFDFRLPEYAFLSLTRPSSFLSEVQTLPERYSPRDIFFCGTLLTGGSITPGSGKSSGC